MSWKTQRRFNYVMVLLSWLSLPLLGKRAIKRFLPASILTTLIEGIHVQTGKRRKWWVFYNKPNSYISGEFPYNIGPFLIGSMWLLKWTYGSFKQFILLFAIVDCAFVLMMSTVFKRIKIFTLVRINKIQFFLYFFLKAFLLYGFQFLFDIGRKTIDRNNINKKNCLQETAAENITINNFDGHKKLQLKK